MNEKKKKIRMNVFWICISLFVILTILVFTGVIHSLDEGMQSMILKMRKDYLTSIFTIFTNMGGAYALLAITILLVLIKRNKKVSLFIAINLVAVFAASQIFKFIFRRDRPMEIFLVNASGYSFPSGHAMVSCAFYLYILYLINRKIQNRALKFIFSTLMILLILLIGFSRIYLGVHYLTDVIGGWILAVGYFMLFLNITGDFVEGGKK